MSSERAHMGQCRLECAGVVGMERKIGRCGLTYRVDSPSPHHGARLKSYSNRNYSQAVPLALMGFSAAYS